jgi:F-type H+-transporting ATPase subunit alpha
MEDKDNYRIAKIPGSGGSLTALPIIETLLGDVSAYIPTNVISITDGQLFLENDLFNAGQRPAINTGISVSRVGSDAQRRAMKRVVGGLKSDLAQYRELAAFAQFGSDLDRATQRQLDRGARLMELLKQPQYEPYSLAHQVMLIFVGTRGMLDEVPVEKANQWSRDFLRYMDTAHVDIGKTITETFDITSETEEALEQAVTDFNVNWSG